MTRYKIDIPAPKASRMFKTDREVIVRLSSSWGGDVCRNYTIPASTTTFSFDVPGHVTYAGTCTACDADVFDVEIHFFNESRTRSETVKPTPVLVADRGRQDA